MQYWWCRTSVWKLSFVFLSVMRVIMPSISATHSTLGQNKVLGCFESTDTSVYVQLWWRRTTSGKMSDEMVPLMRIKLVMLLHCQR